MVNDERRTTIDRQSDSEGEQGLRKISDGLLKESNDLRATAQNLESKKKGVRR